MKYLTVRRNKNGEPNKTDMKSLDWAYNKALEIIKKEF